MNQTFLVRQDFDMNTFLPDVPAGKVSISGFSSNHCYQEDVPKLDSSYMFQREFVRDIRAWLMEPDGDGLYISGPTGCGKTSGVMQLAARLNWPVSRNEVLAFSLLRLRYTWV